MPIKLAGAERVKVEMEMFSNTINYVHGYEMTYCNKFFMAT